MVWDGSTCRRPDFYLPDVTAPRSLKGARGRLHFCSICYSVAALKIYRLNLSVLSNIKIC